MARMWFYAPDKDAMDPIPMTIDPLSSSTSALSSLSGVSPTAGAVAAAGARSLALNVASEVGSQMLAPLSGQGAPQPQPYQIATLAEVLGGALGATPMEVMDIERALEGLAGAVAADFVALADGRTLDRLDAAIAAQEGEMAPPALAATPATVAEQLHEIAADLSARF